MADRDRLLNPVDETNLMLSLRFELERDTNCPGEHAVLAYTVDLLAERDITLNELLEGALAGLQCQAGVAPAARVTLQQAMQLTGQQVQELLEPLGGAALLRTDSREPQDEITAVGGCPAWDEPQAILASLYVLLETLRGFYAGRPLPADRAAELEAETFGLPRPVHIDASFVRQGELTDGSTLSLADGEQLWLTGDHGGKTLDKLGLMSGSSLNFHLNRQGTAPRIMLRSAVNPAFAEKYPLYRISERPVYVFSEEKVQIIPAGEAPKKGGSSLLSILSPLLMAVAMLLMRVLSGGGMSSALTYGLMAGITVLTAVLNLLARRREYQRSLRTWKQQYEEYITRTVQYLQQRCRQDAALLNRLYPPVFAAASQQADGVWKPETDRPAPGSLLEKTAQVSGEIFSRGPTHPQFLTVRLGTSAKGSQLVRAALPVEGEAANRVFAAEGYKNLQAKPGAPFAILLPGEKGDREGYLSDLPAAIANDFRYLEDAPVQVDLRRCACLGVVYPQPLSFRPLMDQLVYQLAMLHSPEDLQLVLLTAAEDFQAQQRSIALYKSLPHFCELFGDLAQTAFDREQAGAVMDRLASVLEKRREEGRDGQKLPHIVVLAEEEFHLASHPLSGYLPRPPAPGQDGAEDFGVSFLFFKRYPEQLPKYCDQTILARPASPAQRTGDVQRDHRFYLVPHTQLLGSDAPRGYDPRVAPYSLEAAQQRYAFCPDQTCGEALLQEGFSQLSALYFYRVAQNGEVPKAVSLYDVLGLQPTKEELAAAGQEGLHGLMGQKLQDYAGANWGRHNADKTLSAPVGLRGAARFAGDPGALVMLDLSQDGDGVHGAVAGSTGSGKTEALIAFLLGLCLKYSPDQLNLVLVDLKGGGFSERLGTLPHVVGSIDNLGGAKGESIGYMLGRFERQLRAEIEYREKQFKLAGADSIATYNEAAADPENCIAQLKPEERQDAERLRRIRAMRPMPHCICVIDEFAEMLKCSADAQVDLRGLVDSLAALGRSLGLHLLLASQNVVGAMNENTKNNTAVYWALKLRDRAASQEMLGVDSAARPTMPGRGRSYLRTGAGGRFEYFQAAYTGGSWRPDEKEPVLLTHMPRAGARTCFYDSRRTGKEEPNAQTQLQLALEQIEQVYRSGLQNGSLHEPRQICLPPLPAELPCDYTELIESDLHESEVT